GSRGAWLVRALVRPPARVSRRRHGAWPRGPRRLPAGHGPSDRTALASDPQAGGSRSPRFGARSSAYPDEIKRLSSVLVRLNTLNGGASAEVRVSFTSDTGASWSAIGTDCLSKEAFPKNQPTMNFGWLDGG